MHVSNRKKKKKKKIGAVFFVYGKHHFSSKMDIQYLCSLGVCTIHIAELMKMSSKPNLLSHMFCIFNFLKFAKLEACQMLTVEAAGSHICNCLQLPALKPLKISYDERRHWPYLLGRNAWHSCIFPFFFFVRHSFFLDLRKF